MSRLRQLLVWLIMAAIPLPGLAAAGMAFCPVGHHGQAAAGVSLPAAADVEHDHADHAQAHELQAGQAAEAGNQSSTPDAGHQCGVCASCCHGQGIAGFAWAPSFAPMPQAGSAEPFVLIHAPPSQLPDKPPRA